VKTLASSYFSYRVHNVSGQSFVVLTTKSPALRNDSSSDAGSMAGGGSSPPPTRSIRNRPGCSSQVSKYCR
jgi:hypothetical protein